MLNNLKIRIEQKKRQGFTLIELMVSISIFMIFLGMVSQSYLSIVRTQRHANEVRKMYSEVRSFMDTLAEDIRLSAVDYDCYNILGNFAESDCNLAGPDIGITINHGRTDTLSLVKKGGMEKIIIKYGYNQEEERGLIMMQRFYLDGGGKWTSFPGYEQFREVFSERLDVSYLSFAIFPDVNPYSSENYRNNAAQFQPKVTVFLGAGNAKSTDTHFNYDFQTTISSRVYTRAI